MSSATEESGEKADDVLERDDLAFLRTGIEERLFEAQQNGADREATARLLEIYADAVRAGHTEPPSRRGRWWQEVHGGDSDD